MTTATSAPEIEIVDASEGVGPPLVELVRRSPTLDGSIPLRAAQACTPLLEGNAFGLQVRLARALVIERRLGRAPRLRAEKAIGEGGSSIERLHDAIVPRLAARGLVSARWARAFERGLVHDDRGVLRLFTGLLVRAPAGAWLRVSSSANRRSAAYGIEEVFVPDDAGLVPLVLGIVPRVAGPLLLDAEIATLAPVVPEVPIDVVELAQAKALAEAHLAFYDATYFAAKRGAPTRKYRKLVASPPREEAAAAARVAVAGPGGLEVQRRDRVLSSDAPAPRPHAKAVSAIVFRALLAFEARWDGLSLVVSWDHDRLAREAQALERTFHAVFGPERVEAQRGALWYLTKYFTPHPPGEPHFFVKPWAFVQTAPGWSSLIDGVAGDGFEVMRGVVSTDVFHATPAVFHVRRSFDPIRVREGEPLIDVVPFPRSLSRVRPKRASLEGAS